MTSEQLVQALNGAISLINPLLDLLAERDPLRLKEHTFDDGEHSGLEAVQHKLAKALDVADWPGTKGWSELSMEQRANWWTTRLGTVNTVALAYPGVLGAWAKALPIATPLGFANQATVLIAIAREYGLTDRAWQTRLLASVLCGRDLPDASLTAPMPSAGPEIPAPRRRSAFRLLWDVGQILRKVDSEMSHRPQPPRPFSTLSWIPLLGAPSLYIGERLALRRAVKAGREWITQHPEAINVSRQPRDGSPHRQA